MKYIGILANVFLLLALLGCDGKGTPALTVNEAPPVFPDYTGVTFPKNMAPPSFEIDGAFRIQAVFKAGDEEVVVKGNETIGITPSDWRSLIEKALSDNRKISVVVSAWTERYPDGVEYSPFHLYVSDDEIDRYVTYRLIPPGYEFWSRMGIYQRNLESYEETAIVTNTQNNNGCVNCHSFCNYDAQKGMMFHARGLSGGTVIYQHGKMQKVMLEQIGPKLSGTYPMWHPGGRFIVFSSNNTRQSFYGHSQDKIEVYDLASDLIVYDVEEHRVLTDGRFTDSLNWETFPSFSPDGKWLYFCTARPVVMPVEYDKLHYSICRVAFDSHSGRLGEQVDTVYSASRQGGSASFPRVSPDGRFLMFTLADCATFPIHHKEADLKMLRLGGAPDFAAVDTDILNSSDVESYHSWSSNGRWVIFSSKRIDGRYTRLYVAHWDGKRFTKPMLLPQKNPEHNRERLYSYNIPEFAKTAVSIDRDKMAELFKDVGKQ